jgi:hypothetical protein
MRPLLVFLVALLGATAIGCGGRQAPDDAGLMTDWFRDDLAQVAHLRNFFRALDASDGQHAYRSLKSMDLMADEMRTVVRAIDDPELRAELEGFEHPARQKLIALHRLFDDLTADTPPDTAELAAIDRLNAEADRAAARYRRATLPRIRARFTAQQWIDIAGDYDLRRAQLEREAGVSS